MSIPVTFQRSGDFRMVAKTMQGLEEGVAKELLRLGARDIEIHRRAVSFTGDTGTLYKTNYQLRLALRILIPVAEFEATSEQEFYDAIRAMPWEECMTADQTLAVDCTLTSERFTHSFFMAQKTKDAVVDRFREKYDRRPSVDTEKPTLRINIHISDLKVTVSLDSSGESLHKRGYREDTGRAPINEVLAAGLITLSGWDRRSRLIDPMCGSGTILIEAALMANHIPPGWFRESFGFQRWPDYDEKLFETIKESAIGRISNDVQELIGLELSSNVLRKARTNIKMARVDDIIKTECINFFDYDPPQGRGTLILNPPYGERMVKDDLVELYSGIGRTLKHKYSGYEAWMITSNPEGLKEVGLRPSRKIPIYNGPLECRFVKYDLYAGSKKLSKQPKEGE